MSDFNACAFWGFACADVQLQVQASSTLDTTVTTPWTRNFMIHGCQVVADLSCLEMSGNQKSPDDQACSGNPVRPGACSFPDGFLQLSKTIPEKPNIGGML